MQIFKVKKFPKYRELQKIFSIISKSNGFSLSPDPLLPISGVA